MRSCAIIFDKVKDMVGGIMKGFSLLELIVVIAIVALLAAIAVPSYAAYRVKTKEQFS